MCHGDLCGTNKDNVRWQVTYWGQGYSRNRPFEWLSVSAAGVVLPYPQGEGPVNALSKCRNATCMWTDSFEKWTEILQIFVTITGKSVHANSILHITVCGH